MATLEPSQLHVLSVGRNVTQVFWVLKRLGRLAFVLSLPTVPRLARNLFQKMAQ
jgi:hypothetical protein